MRFDHLIVRLFIEMSDYQIPDAPTGIASAAEKRGNILVYRMVRNAEEAQAIADGIQEGNPSMGFRAASVVDGHSAGTKQRKIQAAEKKGAIAFFTSPYPSVSFLYESGAGLFLAIEVDPSAVIYQSTRAGKIQGLAYSALFADAEYVVDARGVRAVYELTDAQKKLMTEYVDFFQSQIRRGAFHDTYRDTDEDLVSHNLQRMMDLLPFEASMGRPFIEVPITLPNGLKVQKGSRVRLSTGATGVLNSARELAPEHRQYHGGEPMLLGISGVKGEFPMKPGQPEQRMDRMNLWPSAIVAVYDRQSRKWISAA